MAKSGGPPPSPTALRRSRDAHQWNRLPPFGLTAEHDVPPWPAEFGEASVAELQAWTRLWREQPAAWVWLEQRQDVLVAVYVKLVLQVKNHAAANMVSEMRRMAGELLLTIEMMHRSQYTIDKDVTAPTNGLDAPEREAPGQKGTIVSARDRFGNGGNRASG